MVKKMQYLIVGAGPAGLQMGYYLKRNGRDFVILEQADEPGAFFKVFPRHGFLISINKVHTGKSDPELNLRWDWNSLLCEDEDLRFTRYSKDYFPKPDELRRYLADFAEHYQLPIHYNSRVSRITRGGEGFVVAGVDGEHFETRRLIIATGLKKAYIPEIPGIELCDTYTTHSLDLDEYRDKRVLIVGKGNSGFETANHISQVASVIHLLSPRSIRMAWESHFVGNLRAINNEFLDTYQLKSQNAVIDGALESIDRVNGRYRAFIRYSHANGQVTEREYDHVIVCTGFGFDASIFDESCRPGLTLDNKFPAMSTAWESENVEDLYFAGTLMQACDYKKTQSAFIHGFRHNIRALSWVLEEKYHQNPWPYQSLPLSVTEIVAKVIERINTGAGLFQQPGFLCDALVIDEADALAQYYDEVRLEHVLRSYLADKSHYYVITLEYGVHQDDPFSVERDPAPDKGGEAFYLHPVIRRYARDKLVAVHHINDDLENEWLTPEYVQPVVDFFSTQLPNG